MLLCLSALHPLGAALIQWMDGKATDLFFVLPLPERWRGEVAHPVVVVAKDTAFTRLAQPVPLRRSFAQALAVLAPAGATVAGFDFLFDEGREPDVDRAFIDALRAFPWPILGQRFLLRQAVGEASQLSLSDLQAAIPPPPEALHGPIAAAAPDRGLVNIVLDYDGVVRAMPLAFQTVAGEEFLPSLGMAVWLGHQLAEARPQLERAGLPAVPPPGGDLEARARAWLAAAVAAGPRPFQPTGHTGLDALARRWEARWLARWAARRAGLAPEEPGWQVWEQVGQTLPPAGPEVPTWLDLPAGGLPWLGAWTAPCLRVRFTRVAVPKGDGLPVDSLGLLVESTALGGRGRLTVTPALAGSGPVDLAFDLAPPGSWTVVGRALDQADRPLAGLEVMAWPLAGGYWATGTTDADGRFRLTGLAPGSHTVQAIWSQGPGRQVLTLEVGIPAVERPLGPVASAGRLAEGAAPAAGSPASPRTPADESVSAAGAGEAAVVELPVAHFLTASAALEVAVPVATVPQVLAVRGNPLWIERTGPGGTVGVATLPAGFEATVLEDFSTPVFEAGGRLLGPDGPLPPGQAIAFTDAASPWQAEIAVLAEVPPGSSQVRLPALPPGRELQVELWRSDLPPRSPLDPVPEHPLVDLVMGETASLSTGLVAGPADLELVPVRVRLATASAGVALVFRDGLGQQVLARAAEEPIALRPGIWRVFCAETGGPGRRGTYNRLVARYGGRAVFFGTHLAEDRDTQVTPVNFLDRDFKEMAGVNLHAHLCSCLLRRDFLRPLPLHPDASPRSWPLWTLLALFPCLVGIDVLVARRGAVAGGVGTALLMLLWSGAALGLFLHGWVVPVALPLLALGSFGVGRGFHAYTEVRRRERLVRSSFGRFVSNKMVEEIVRNPDVVKPGGEKKELTVMFTDLAGFTTISEMLAPEQLAGLMNEYLGEMTDLVFQFDGTLDKYIGDAVMAFWNHPGHQPDHAVRAVRCALAMQKRLAQLRQIWRARGLPDVSMRAGLNTAECMVGFYGSSIQMNFTCLGDGVNLASRLEGANKAYGTLMMMAESTQQRLAGSGIRTRFLDFLAVKGKQQPIKTYELIGVEGEDDDLWDKVLPLYARGIEAYLARRWDEAEAALLDVLALRPDDGPSRTYLERIAAFRETPPPPDWDGSFHLKTK
ncbi:MAG: Adenylate cyclase [Candidatus Ozemobacter sibiricus]|uniref:Adenylate cyclase n=1 Tax=Candidatus Ozemobacter sibiricus TaxID=2268124 RepID=A0A367ZK14_9BACT|nr:MAG: Adenylate cyclase [Candidatus Ozemobacter sibiricus]